jgi:hypothetical protein
MPDMNTDRSPAAQFVSKVSNFCNTKDPNLFDLAIKLRELMKAAVAPSAYDPYLVRMTSVVDQLQTKFTSTPGMNVPTTSINVPTTGMNVPTTSINVPTTGMIVPTPSASQPTGNGARSWGQSTMTKGDTIPTEYLAQVPPNWPYTEYGIMRKAGKTTSFPFVNPNATTQTVAWLYHQIHWNPRPLYTPPAEKAKRNDANAHATLYQPLLENWTHQFIYEMVPATSAVAAPHSAAQALATLISTSKMATSGAAASSPSPTVSSPSPTASQQLPLSRDPDSSDGVLAASVTHSEHMGFSNMAKREEGRCRMRRGCVE